MHTAAGRRGGEEADGLGLALNSSVDRSGDGHDVGVVLILAMLAHSAARFDGRPFFLDLLLSLFSSHVA